MTIVEHKKTEELNSFDMWDIPDEKPIDSKITLDKYISKNDMKGVGSMKTKKFCPKIGRAHV